MLPHEQLEHNAAASASSADGEFPYCLRCAAFTYLDYVDRCMRCNGRNIIWKEIPQFAPKPRVPRGTFIICGLLFIAATVLAVWLLR